MSQSDLVRENVRDYYGAQLNSAGDLKTNACCTTEAVPEHHKPLIKKIHNEVLEQFYGCGSPIPAGVEGCTVLDLGCGTGRDAYLLSALVGPEGYVTGLDMTEEQLAVARRHIDYHTEQFGYDQPNLEFRQGYLEDLATAGIADNSMDIVISNCVLNLAADKERAFSEIFRVLKPGGELYFSDVFADRRIPFELQDDPVLYGECLSGALYIEDFRRLLSRLGCPDYRTVSSAPITIENEEVESKIGMVQFRSLTIRVFKLDSLEDLCEDYGQIAYYQGTISGSPHGYRLDDHHYFETGRPVLVCGNTAAMLEQTRLKSHFHIQGDRSVHFGAFDCHTSSPEQQTVNGGNGACC